MSEKIFYIVKNDENRFVALFTNLEDCKDFIDNKRLEEYLKYDEVVL